MSKELREEKGALLVLALAFIISLCGGSYATIFPCSTCADCNTKIAGAASGDVVRVSVDLASNVACINFNARNGVTLDCANHKIKATNSGIWVYAGSGIVIQNCNSSYNGLYGIYMAECSNCRISSNKVGGNHASGIVVLNSPGIVIESNNVELNWKHGIDVQSSSSVTIRNNHVFNHPGSGIVMASSPGTVYCNCACNSNAFDVSANTGGYSAWSNTCTKSQGWNDAGYTGCRYKCPNCGACIAPPVTTTTAPPTTTTTVPPTTTTTTTLPTTTTTVPLVNNASFVGQGVPAMCAGGVYNVSVTMKNTGTTNWTAAGNYRLGSQNPPDNLVWGTGRAYLSGSDYIVPGAQKAFSFTVTAPGTPGVYNFQWRMVQEAVEWFGSFTANLAVNVANCTTTTTTSTTTTTHPPAPPTTTTTSTTTTTTAACYKDVSFKYVATDDNGLKNCSIWTDTSGAWRIDQTSIAVGNGALSSFVLSHVASGVYRWSIQCFDTVKHEANASNAQPKGYWVFKVPCTTSTTSTTTSTTTTTTTHPPTTTTTTTTTHPPTTTTTTTTTQPTTTTTTTTTTHPPTTTTTTTTHPPTTTTTSTSTTTHPPTTTTTTTTHPPTTTTSTTTHPPTTTTTTTTHPPTTTTIPPCNARTDAGTAHLQSTGVTTGTCNNNFDCVTGVCVNNLCCPTGYCGHIGGTSATNQCWKIGQGTTFGNVYWLCYIQGFWQMARGESCVPNNNICCGFEGLGCMNNYCCKGNQCGFGSNVAHGNCYDPGQTATIGGIVKTCCGSGYWDFPSGHSCVLNSECCSNYCAGGPFAGAKCL